MLKRSRWGHTVCVSLSCVTEGLTALSGDTKYPGVQCYLAVWLKLNFIFVRLCWLTEMGTGFNTNSALFL